MEFQLIRVEKVEGIDHWLKLTSHQSELVVHNYYNATEMRLNHLSSDFEICWCLEGVLRCLHLIERFLHELR